MTAFFEQHQLTADDGAPIGYQVAGRRGGRSVLLCNGLGGNFYAYEPLVSHMRERYRFAVWDYRGLFSSAPTRVRPRPGWLERDRLRLERHARDGLEVARAQGFDRFALVGWSMGVQVALEIYRLAGERVAGMVLMNGIAGSFYRTLFGGLPAAERWMPCALRALRATWPLANAVTRAVTRWPRALDAAVALRLVGPTLDREAARKVLRSFGDIDQDLYLEQVEVLGEHDASDILPRVRCPTLVLASDRDVFTPGFATRELARAIPDAELAVFSDGTHYAPIEFADQVNRRVAGFLARRVYGKAQGGSRG